MFERFTNQARRVLVLAQGAAVELRSPITPGHMLLGCWQAEPGPAATTLRNCGVAAGPILAALPHGEGSGPPAIDPDALRTIGIDYQAIRAAVEENFGAFALDVAPDRTAGPRGGRPPFTPDAKRCLEYALREALQLHHRHIGTEHVLLGLLHDPSGQVADLLSRSGTSPDAVRAEVLRLVGSAQEGSG